MSQPNLNTSHTIDNLSQPNNTSHNDERQRTLYFAYGSNLSKKQMRSRCPTSEFYGLAVLRGWRWIIGTRGYANVVKTGKGERKEKRGTVAALGSGKEERDDKEEKEEEDEGEVVEEGEGSEADYVVYGLLYHLEPEDEEELDVAEGVPFAYVKRWEDVEVLSSPLTSPSSFHQASKNEKADTAAKERSGFKVKALIYVDEKRTLEGSIQEEYIRRMNRGIIDALEEGMSSAYVERVMRRWVVAEEEVGREGNEGREGRGRGDKEHNGNKEGEKEVEVEDPFYPRRVVERTRERVDGWAV